MITITIINNPMVSPLGQPQFAIIAERLLTTELTKRKTQAHDRTGE